MAGLPTQQSPAPAVGNPRSPWFWAVSGVGTLALGIATLAILTRAGVLPRSDPLEPPPAARDPVWAQAPGLADLVVPPPERNQELKVRLGQIEAEMERLKGEQERLQASLTAASARGAVTGGADVAMLRALLNELDALRLALYREKVRVSQELGNP